MESDSLLWRGSACQVSKPQLNGEGRLKKITKLQLCLWKVESSAQNHGSDFWDIEALPKQPPHSSAPGEVLGSEERFAGHFHPLV